MGPLTWRPKWQQISFPSNVVVSRASQRVSLVYRGRLPVVSLPKYPNVALLHAHVKYQQYCVMIQALVDEGPSMAIESKLGGVLSGTSASDRRQFRHGVPGMCWNAHPRSPRHVTTVSPEMTPGANTLRCDVQCLTGFHVQFNPEGSNRFQCSALSVPQTLRGYFNFIFPSMMSYYQRGDTLCFGVGTQTLVFVGWRVSGWGSCLLSAVMNFPC